MKNWSLILIVSLLCLSFVSCNRHIDSELVVAAGTGDATKVNDLLQKGARLDAVALDTWTPLTAAVKGRHLNTVKTLAEHGAKIDGFDGGGNTALFWAVYYGDEPIVQYLIPKGADVNA